MSTRTGVRHVSCSLAFEVTAPITLVLQVAPSGTAGGTSGEQLDARLDGAPVAVEERSTAYDGRAHVLLAAPGHLRVSYAATVADAEPDPPADNLLVTLRPSRYCPSDRMAGFARAQLGGATPAEVAAWVRGRTLYLPGASRGEDDAVDTLLAGQGVCRDFAHLTVALCRALELPARLASAYAPGLWPMDFHAVAEVFADGVWQVHDATGLSARQHLVRIATGRDAADTAFAEVLGGMAELTTVEITAVVEGDLVPDDGLAPLCLA